MPDQVSPLPNFDIFIIQAIGLKFNSLRLDFPFPDWPLPLLPLEGVDGGLNQTDLLDPGNDRVCFYFYFSNKKKLLFIVIDAMDK